MDIIHIYNIPARGIGIHCYTWATVKAPKHYTKMFL